MLCSKILNGNCNFKSALYSFAKVSCSSSLNSINNKNKIKELNLVRSIHNTNVRLNCNHWEEFSIPVPWGHIAGKARGNKNGQPVLLIHGWLDNAGSYDILAPLLPESLRLVAIDLPGHGLSSHLLPGSTYNLMGFVLSIRRVVKHLKWDQYSLIGHSMGAISSQLYSAIYQSEIKRLVLLDLVKPISIPLEKHHEWLSMRLDKQLALERKRKFEAPAVTYNEAVKQTQGGYRHPLSEEAAKILLVRGATQLGAKDKWQYNRDFMASLFDMIRYTHEESYTFLQRIKCPVLLLKAKDNPDYEPTELVQKGIEVYRQNSSDFRLVPTTGGHYFHMNNPLPAVEEIVSIFRS